MEDRPDRQHRTDPKERLLHRFYEPLHLLAILNASRGPGETDFPAEPQSRDFKIMLRRFLDDLSWLCDNKHGGETVSAVALESLPEGNRFWLVTKYEASFEHLKQILEELNAMSDVEDDELHRTADRIAEKSIKFSREKIRNYVKSLKLSLKRIKEKKDTLQITVSGNTIEYGSSLSISEETQPILTRSTESLISALEALTRLTDPLEVCRASKSFKKHKLIDQLLRMHNSIEHRSPWALVRHYVGRLSSWFNKCRNIVHMSVQFPQLLHNATCGYITLPKPSRVPTSDSKTNLRSALNRMLPVDQQHLVRQLYEQVESLRTFDIPDAFEENMTDESLTRYVHAEVYLMEHFYFNKLQFVGREKYIGCSKASCYCCSLYFRFHPGNFVMRPAHNNVFVMWCPPLLEQLEDQSKWRHNRDIVNQMNAYMRRDILEEIDHRIPRREQAPDSTTGASSCSVITQG